MSITKRYQKVAEEVRSAAVSAGNAGSSVKLIAVTKSHSAEMVREAIAAGAVCLGENKVQEGLSKIEEIGSEGVEWHLIGHLQKNKVRKAVAGFDVIHTVDSLELAKRIERIAGEESRAIRVFIQVDLAGEKSKSGVSEGGMFEMADFLKQASNLEFEGLMTIPPYFEDPEEVRPYFKQLRELRDELREEGIFTSKQGELSMGMSHDFRVAIEEGATHVRIGTAIFGAREPQAE